MDPVVDHAREVIEKGSKSFAAAAKLFDSGTREKAFLLYAWCRYCDDQIDGQELGFGQSSPTADEQHKILDRLRAATESAMRGERQFDPVFQGFQRVYRDCQLPRRYPLDLLQGFAMDADQHQYQTLEDTLLYCYHVAGCVGAMMAKIMGVQEPDVLNRAVDLGLAFQLTNICRDVMEDAADGRCYLPTDWLTEAGAPTDPADFEGQEAPVFRVVGRLLEEADRYYDSALHGVAHLPLRCAWAIAAARSVYREIGELVRARGADALGVRASVSGRRKAGLLAASFGTAASARLFRRRRQAPSRDGLWSVPEALA